MKQLKLPLRSAPRSWQELVKNFFEVPNTIYLQELERTLAFSPTMAERSSTSLIIADGIRLLPSFTNTETKLLLCRFVLRLKCAVSLPLVETECKAIAELIHTVTRDELVDAKILNQLDVIFYLLAKLTSLALIPESILNVLVSHAIYLVFEKEIPTEGLKITATNLLLAVFEYQHAKSVDAMLRVLDGWETGSCGTFYMAHMIIRALVQLPTSKQQNIGTREYFAVKWSLHILANIQRTDASNVRSLLLEVLSAAQDIVIANEALLFIAVFLNCLFRSTRQKGAEKLTKVLYDALTALPEALLGVIESPEAVRSQFLDTYDPTRQLAQNIYLQITELICQLAALEDLSYACRNMVFRALSQITKKFPQVIDTNWFHRPVSAEARLDLISISWNYWRVSNDLRPFNVLCSETLLSNSSCEQKARVLDILKEKSGDCPSLYVTVWVLTIAVALSSPSQVLNGVGVRVATNYFNTEGSIHGLAEAILTVRKSSLESAFYAGLRKYFEGKQHLCTLTAQGHRSVIFLVNLLLHLDLVEEAEIIIRCDGHYLPQCWFSFGIFVTTGNPASIRHKSPWLNIMQSALKSVDMDLVRTLRQKFVIGMCLRTILTCSLDAVSLLGMLIGVLASDKPSMIFLDRLAEKCSSALNRVAAGQLSKTSTIRLLLLISSMRYWRTSEERTKQLVYKLIQLDSKSLDETLRLSLTYSILNICFGHGLFIKDQCVKSYTSLVVSRQSDLRVQCIRLILDLLCANDIKDISDSSQRAMKVPIGIHESDKFLSRLIESNIEAVVDTFGTDLSFAQLKMLQQATQRGILPSKHCIPLVISGCFSSNRALSEQALSTLDAVCQRYFTDIDSLIVKGILEVKDPSTAHYQNFAKCWLVLQKGRSARQRHSILEKFGLLFRFAHLSKAQSTLLVKSLQSACFAHKEACWLAHCIELCCDTEENREVAQLCRFLREQGNLMAPRL